MNNTKTDIFFQRAMRAASTSSASQYKDLEVLRGTLGLYSPKIARKHVITIENKLLKRGRGQQRGTRVVLYGPGSGPGTRKILAEKSFFREEYRADAKNRIGQMGAFVDVDPSDDEVVAMIEKVMRPVAPPTRMSANYFDEDGNAVDLEGESIQEIAAQLGKNEKVNLTVYDDNGSIRGWIHSRKEWRSA